MANRQGSSKAHPGAWSLALSADFDKRIRARPGFTYPEISRLTGISAGRLTPLLNGKKSWYLEDVEKFCDLFELDIIKYLKSLSVGITILKAPPLRLVADKQKRKVGTETDEGFTGA